MLVDLNDRSGFVYGRATDASPPLGARINTLLDTALVTERAGQRPRDYLGASRIGESRARRLVYEVTHTPPDPGKELEGRSLRIFAAGHVFEDLAISWPRLAGLDLRTRDSAILRIATMPREGAPIPMGAHDDHVWKMSRHEVGPAQMPRGGQVLCGTNAMPRWLNTAITRAAGFEATIRPGAARRSSA